MHNTCGQFLGKYQITSKMYVDVIKENVIVKIQILPKNEQKNAKKCNFLPKIRIRIHVDP